MSLGPTREPAPDLTMQVTDAETVAFAKALPGISPGGSGSETKLAPRHRRRKALVEEGVRVDRAVAYPDFIVEVGRSNPARSSGCADELPHPDLLAGQHIDPREVGIAGLQAAAVIHDDQV